MEAFSTLAYSGILSPWLIKRKERGNWLFTLGKIRRKEEKKREKKEKKGKEMYKTCKKEQIVQL